MKKLFITAILLCIMLSGCSSKGKSQVPVFENGQLALKHLIESNSKYLKMDTNNANISPEIRSKTSTNGQNPYAVIVSCSDSRVPSEHIFNAGIGELFVIRTAGNVVSTFELGSIEYGVQHLEVPLILVLGHEKCGAVSAAISGEAHGNIKAITDEISDAIGSTSDASEAEILNVKNTISVIKESEIIAHLLEEEKTIIKGAIYNTETGEVKMID